MLETFGVATLIHESTVTTTSTTMKWIPSPPLFPDTTSCSRGPKKCLAYGRKTCGKGGVRSRVRPQPSRLASGSAVAARGGVAVTSSVLMMSLEMKSRMFRGVEGLASFVCRNFIQGGSSVATTPCLISRGEFSVYEAVKVQTVLMMWQTVIG